MHRSQDGGKTFSGNGGTASPSRRDRRAAATVTTSGSIRRIRSATSWSTTAARRSTRTTASSACAFRTARCTTCTSTTACRTGSTATARTTGRCADRRRAPRRRQRVPARGQHDAAGRRRLRARARRRRRRRWRTGPGRRGADGGSERARAPGADATAPATAWQPNIGGCESGFTHSRPDQRRHRLRELLRQQGDALGRAHRHGALDRAVDGHRSTRRRTKRSIAATGPRRWRSIRSIRTTCSTAAS